MSIQTLKTEIKSAGNEYKVECTARGKSFILDEPEEFGGSNGGMNPGEALLNALGACKYMVVKMFCGKFNIHLQEIKITMEGQIDPDGMDDDNNVKLGFSKIITNYHIKANNTNEEIKKFVDYIEQHCPMKDTIYNRPEMVEKVNII